MSDEVSRRAREDELDAEWAAKKAARDEADLIKAREWAADEYVRRGASFLAKLATAGKADDAVSVLGFLAGLKAGRAEREEG